MTKYLTNRVKKGEKDTSARHGGCDDRRRARSSSTATRAEIDTRRRVMGSEHVVRRVRRCEDSGDARDVIAVLTLLQYRDDVDVQAE